MSLMELGALGEFLGSIGVIATLIYLAIQIRQNTLSLDDARNLAMAQTYQARAQHAEEYLRSMSQSDHWPSINLKLGGWETHSDITRVEELTAVEKERLRLMQLGRLQQLDNLFYQYKRGYLAEEYYEHNVVQSVRLNARYWRQLEIWPWKPSFREEVDRILSESEAESAESEQ